MPTFSAQLPDQLFPSPFSLPFQWLPSAYPGELKKGLMWRKMTIDIYVTVRSCRLKADWWQPSGDRFLPALSAWEGDAGCATHWSALQPETLCSAVFKIFQNAQSQQKESRDSNVHKAPNSNVCAKEIWHVWTPHPEKAFSPFFPTLFLFFLVPHHILRFESL